MTLKEILQKIQGLSPEDRDILRRELDEIVEKPDAQSATPQTVANLHKAQQSSHDERGLPLEDVLEPPRPKDGA